MRVWWLVALALVLSAPLHATSGERRVALLIGNNLALKHRLANAANDANDMSEALKQSGFTTTVVIDGTTGQMRDAVEAFGKDLANAEAALFFFAGNALQFDTRIFMLSTETERDDPKFMQHSVEIARLFQLIREGKPRHSFIVFDSNRDEVDAEQRPKGMGPASGDPPLPPNTLAAYATEVGGTASDGFGRNGLFTLHILEQIRTPALPAELVFRRARQGVIAQTRSAKFKQLPQESSSLTGDFFFVAATPAPPAPRMVFAPPPGERRVALVVGNGAYKVGPLPNTLNDASDVAVALEKAGFRVILRRDAGQREMKSAIREFERELANSDVGLFYYAGHGLQIRGNNFLVPVDADMQSEADAEDQSIDANFVLRVLDDAQAKVGIVILDACRNNPLPRRTRAPVQGLAQMNAASGTLIAFATSPGSTAIDGMGTDRNGVYVKHLLRSLDNDDTDILKVFQRTRAGVVRETKGVQVPWESTSLMGDFRFRVPVAAK